MISETCSPVDSFRTNKKETKTGRRKRERTNVLAKNDARGPAHRTRRNERGEDEDDDDDDGGGNAHSVPSNNDDDDDYKIERQKR